MKGGVGKNGMVWSAFFTSLLILLPYWANATPDEHYMAVPGLMDLRSTYSDGVHSIEELARMAGSRGFKLLFINDHDRIAIAYGIPPFRNIFRYKKEFPSILSHGARGFLREIDRVSRMYPDMIIIPGSETSAHYYWTGSYLNGDLTVNDYDRRMIILNFNDPDDYDHIPNLHNKLSVRYSAKLLPLTMILLCPFFIGILLMTWRGIVRTIGIILVVLSVLAIVDHNPFRSSMFTQYDGDQGITPYQELIDYVNEKGSFSFWNYPEQKSGARTHGPINVHTPPYPQVLHQSRNYTGFAAIYGDQIKATEPGREWDRVLNEYCRGQRERPPWGISAADFHKDGFLRIRLGAFPTTFLVKEFSKEAILEAIEKGRMYCSRGDSKTWPKLDYFTISGGNGRKCFMGETLYTSLYPLIRFKISHDQEKPGAMTLFLIRGGEVIHKIVQKPPIEIEYQDRDIPVGEKSYYRIMDAKKDLTSNPIFVIYNPDSSN